MLPDVPDANDIKAGGLDASKYVANFLRVIKVLSVRQWVNVGAHEKVAFSVEGQPGALTHDRQIWTAICALLDIDRLRHVGWHRVDLDGWSTLRHFNRVVLCSKINNRWGWWGLCAWVLLL